MSIKLLRPRVMSFENPGTTNSKGSYRTCDYQKDDKSRVLSYTCFTLIVCYEIEF